MSYQPDYLRIEETTDGTFKLWSDITSVDASNVYSSEQSPFLIGEYDTREAAQIMLDLEIIKIQVHALTLKLRLMHEVTPRENDSR